MASQHSFGNWLRLRRKALDLTREGLAERVGYSAATIRKIETEERRPSAQIIQRLGDVFDIPPGERAGFLRFARGDWSSISDYPVAADTPWRAAPKPPHSALPSPVTSFIGQEKEIKTVRDYLLNPAIRLVTLIGPPGIGKTRLCLEVARAVASEFADGAFFVPLAPVGEPLLIAPAVIQTLGFAEAKGKPDTQLIVDAIGEKQLLLVLDNCEHLIDAVAPFVVDLLSACPRLNILATSRESMRVPGEWLLSVPPLARPSEHDVVSVEAASTLPALALFVARARAVRADFALNEGNIRTVAAICTRLDGLPLAIELLASRIRLMSPQTLLDGLKDQFILSADGMRAVPARHKTLFNAISWSYDHLTPDEKRLFVCLAVFSGGFTLVSAEAVAGRALPGKPVTDLVTSLVDKSLLYRAIDGRDEVRLAMLVTIRQFALDKLRQTGEEAKARDRHLTHFLALVEQGEGHMRGPHQVEWGERLASEYDNFCAALDWAVSSGRTEIALRILGALGWPWEVRGRYREMRLWLDKIRALPDIDHYPLYLAKVLNHVGRHSWTQDNLRDAHLLLEESRDIAQEMGIAGERRLAEALNWLGLVVLLGDRDSEAARPLIEQSLALNQKWGDEWNVALSTFHLGLVEGNQKHEEEARDLYEKSLSLFKSSGDLFFIARVSLFLGYWWLEQGNYDRARFYLEERLRIDTEIQFWDGMAEGWRDLGFFYRRTGDHEEAGRCFAASLAICREHGLTKANILYELGVSDLHRDDYAAARRHFTDYFNMTRDERDGRSAVDLIAALAAVAAGSHQPEQAARLSGAAEQALATGGKRDYPADAAELDRHLRIAREALGAGLFAALQAEGRAMSPDQALTSDLLTS